MIAIRNSDGEHVIAREVLEESKDQILAFLLSYNVDPTKVSLVEGDWIIVDRSEEPPAVSLVSAISFLDDYDEEWVG